MSNPASFEEPIDLTDPSSPPSNNNPLSHSDNPPNPSTSLKDDADPETAIDIPLRDSALKDLPSSNRVSEAPRYTLLDKPFTRNTTTEIEANQSSHPKPPSSQSLNPLPPKQATPPQKSAANSLIRRFRFKIILLGESAVGKTSFINRYISNSFTKKYSITIAPEAKKKRISYDDNTKVELTIWDTVGEERFRAMTKTYFTGAHGAIIVFDVTNVESFNKLQLWIDMVKENAPENIVINLVGNKSDKSEERTVGKVNAEKFALEKEISYFEASACDGTNVSIVFEDLAVKMVNANQGTEKNESFDEDESRKLSKYSLDVKDNNKKKCCGK